MIMTINEFLDLCKSQTATLTDSNLARKVDVTRAAIAAYRKGASFPSDENMVRLAKRADLHIGTCLLLLNYWRSSGAAQKEYKRLFAQSESLMPK